MSMSGSRLQLAIAPAGAGKTTALRALTRAWTDSGGQVLGLAPSAAAAAQLRESIGAPTDTLAKLSWSIDHSDLPDWASSAAEPMLVIIDEAGMADTLSLDAAVDFIVQRGGSIRLIGDDQQLPAIGAGGILRDIQAVHGADRLTQLHRFDDQAETVASLVLRDGRPEALGFYLDRQRVHHHHWPAARTVDQRSNDQTENQIRQPARGVKPAHLHCSTLKSDRHQRLQP